MQRPVPVLSKDQPQLGSTGQGGWLREVNDTIVNNFWKYSIVNTSFMFKVSMKTSVRTLGYSQGMGREVGGYSIVL